jgi:hypothetical protein
MGIERCAMTCARSQSTAGASGVKRIGANAEPDGRSQCSDMYTASCLPLARYHIRYCRSRICQRAKAYSGRDPNDSQRAKLSRTGCEVEMVLLTPSSIGVAKCVAGCCSVLMLEIIGSVFVGRLLKSIGLGGHAVQQDASQAGAESNGHINIQRN